MFNHQLNAAQCSANIRTQQRIAQLCAISEECEQQAVHPAQGLRLWRRAQATTQLTPDLTTQQGVHAALSALILDDACATPTVQTARAPAADHYLTQTILPRPHQFAADFTVSVLDIQPDVHFIRTQRRYNKRRYARVRATSRPSFWAGMMLSTVSTGAFWGSTIQQIDWQTTILVMPDPNLLVLAGYLLLGYKTARLMARAGSPRYREYTKARRGLLMNMPIL